MQWVLLAFVVAFFGVIEFRLLRDRLRLAPVRSAVRNEAVVYRTPISAQWSRGWWGRGNAKGMRLVVRQNSFELSYPFPGGSLLTTEWYCMGKDARMKVGQRIFCRLTSNVTASSCQSRPLIARTRNRKSFFPLLRLCEMTSAPRGTR